MAFRHSGPEGNLECSFLVPGQEQVGRGGVGGGGDGVLTAVDLGVVEPWLVPAKSSFDNGEGTSSVEAVCGFLDYTVDIQGSFGLTVA